MRYRSERAKRVSGWSYMNSVGRKLSIRDGKNQSDRHIFKSDNYPILQSDVSGMLSRKVQVLVRHGVFKSHNFIIEARMEIWKHI